MLYFHTQYLGKIVTRDYIFQSQTSLALVLFLCILFQKYFGQALYGFRQPTTFWRLSEGQLNHRIPLLLIILLDL